MTAPTSRSTHRRGVLAALLLAACASDPLPLVEQFGDGNTLDRVDFAAPPPDVATAPDLTIVPDFTILPDFAPRPDYSGPACGGGPLLTARKPWPAIPQVARGGLLAADLDKDGRLDLVTVGGTYPNVSALVAWGNGDGTFAAPVPVFPIGASYGSNVAVTDLNQDGRLDILVVLGTSDLAVSLATGARTYAPPVQYAGGAGIGSMVMGDVDEDGRADVIVGWARAWWRRSKRDGTLDEPLEIGSLQCQSLAVGDINEDGHLDVIGGTGPVVYFGDGKGKFPLQGSVKDAGLQAPSLSHLVADVNGDRHLDVIYDTQNQKWLGVALGHGDGTFAAPAHYPAPGGPLGLVAADLDGRPGLDLLEGDPRTGRIGVLLNQGDGSFAAPVEFETGQMAGGKRLATGDFNRDGQTDVAVSGGGYLELPVFLGSCR